MSLRVQDGEIPENAVFVTRNEAINYQLKQILEWKPRSEVWPFRHGVGLLAGVAMFSSFCINTKFRKSLKYTHYGYISTNLTTGCFSAIMSMLGHSQFVMTDTIMPMPPCAMCIDMKATLVQTGAAIAYPMVLVPVINLLLAKRTGTFRFPHHASWKELLYFCGNLYKPFLPLITILCGLNFTVASFIVYKQLKCRLHLSEVIDLVERSKIEDNLY